MLSDVRQTELRRNNTNSRRIQRSDNTSQTQHPNTQWWDRVAVNVSEISHALGLHWNRQCKNCNIKVSLDPLTNNYSYFSGEGLYRRTNPRSMFCLWPERCPLSPPTTRVSRGVEYFHKPPQNCRKFAQVEQYFYSNSHCGS
jgi:hypothetical protein